MNRFHGVPSIIFRIFTSRWGRGSSCISAERGRRLSDRVRSRAMAIVVMSLTAVSTAHAEEVLPSQDQALARALVNHPGIVAAKAKVALAEAELYGKRMEVSRQVLGLYGSLKMLEVQIDASKANLSRLKAEFEKAKGLAASGAADQSTEDKIAAEVHAAEAHLVSAIGEREQAEKELRLLIGNATQAAEAASPLEAASANLQAPQGPIVEKVRIVLEKPIKLDFVETPLQQIMQMLSDDAGVMFSIQRPVLESIALSVDAEISLRTNEVRLRDALQAFEDANPDLQFVLRDYGILLTTKDYAQEQGYAPVLDLSKESANAARSH